MSSINEKAAFLRNKFVPLLLSIPVDKNPSWGKMNVLQMIEHMSYAFRQANGRDKYEIVTPEELLPKMQAFLTSEKPFRKNTPNSLLPDEPAAAIHTSVANATEELKGEIEHFFEVFGAEPDAKITNPFFGVLGYEQWIQLLYKHSWHHLKQFGIEHI